MKIAIQITLLVVIAVLGYFIYAGIQKPIQFENEKNRRYEAAIQRLKDIRTGQLAFKAENRRYTASFDTLISFLKTDSFRVVMSNGNVPDSLTEAQALKAGIIIRDTIKVSVKDSLFKSYPIDSMRFIPYSNGKVFDMGASWYETSSKIKIPVFEAKVHNDDLLNGLDRQLIINFNEERQLKAGFPGLKVGGLTETNNNAGNWE